MSDTTHMQHDRRQAIAACKRLEEEVRPTVGAVAMITEESEIARSHATTIAAILGKDQAWEGTSGTARGIGVAATIVQAIAAKIGCTDEQLLNDVQIAMTRGSVQIIESYRTDPDDALDDTILGRWAGLVVLLASEANTGAPATEAMGRYENSVREAREPVLVSGEFEPQLREAMQEAAQAIGIDWHNAWNAVRQGASKTYDESPPAPAGDAMERAIAALGIGTQQLARAVNAKPHAVWDRVRTWLNTRP